MAAENKENLSDLDRLKKIYCSMNHVRFLPWKTFFRNNPQNLNKYYFWFKMAFSKLWENNSLLAHEWESTRNDFDAMYGIVSGLVQYGDNNFMEKYIAPPKKETVIKPLPRQSFMEETIKIIDIIPSDNDKENKKDVKDAYSDTKIVIFKQLWEKYNSTSAESVSDEDRMTLKALFSNTDNKTKMELMSIMNDIK